MLRLSLRASHELAAPLHPTARAAWMSVTLILAIAVFIPHLPGETAAAPSLIAPVPANTNPLPAAGSARCQECHFWEETFTHPVNITPTLSVPSHLPLENGKLVCTTCHTAAEHTGRGAGSMLRTATSESLCSDCHTGGKSRRDMHGSGLAKAHLSTRRTAPAAPPSGFERLDRESEACMTCHDGTTATDVGSHALSGSVGLDARTEHPLGVRYQDRRSGGKDIAVVEMNRLDRRIRLFGQSIGCGSCHSPYSRHKDLLVIENDRSRLCLSCHQQ